MSATALSHTRTKFRNTLSLILIFPVMIIVFLSVGVAVASMFENIRFAHATDQVINLVASTHDVAVHEKNFALQPGEDLLATMVHNGFVRLEVNDATPVTLINPWGLNVRAFVAAPNTMRVEADVPTRDCQRLASFLAHSSGAVWLQYMEAHEGQNGGWRRFYDNTHASTITTDRQAQAACGRQNGATLAMVFRVR